MDSKEIGYHFLIHIVRYLIFDSLHVLVELGEMPSFRVRVPTEEHGDVGLRLALFGEER